MPANLAKLKKIYSSTPRSLKQLFAAVPWSWRMGSEYRATFRFLVNSLYWDKEKWHLYQTSRLRELMQYCENFVPYYSEIFPRLAVNVSAVDIWAEFAKIPLIDKNFVTGNLQKFVVKTKHSGLYSATTGGTTGKPMRTFYDNGSYSKEWAFKMFFWNWAIGYQPTDKKATFRGVNFGAAPYLYNPIYNEIRFSPFHLDEKSISEVVDKLIEYSPRYIHGYPSAIERVGRYLIRKGVRLSGLRGLILISENIYPQQKRVIETAFGLPIYSFYGHSERLIFASMGPELDTYYAHPAYGITELIDEDGQRIMSPGIRGELVGTGFINAGMPLLRFRTGDYSAWEKRESRVSMPMLGDIQGRWKQEYLVGRFGKLISLTALNMHSDVYSRITQMQYRQDSPGIVRLNIVSDVGFSDKDERLILREHEEKLGEEFHLQLSYVTSLEKTGAGKIPYLIQNLEV